MEDEKPRRRGGRRPLQPGESSAQQREAVLISWANTEDWSARTAAGRAAQDRAFLEQAGGDPRRAAAARRAYMIGLARKSAEARKARKAAREAEAAQT